jgi:hypothetical protein
MRTELKKEKGGMGKLSGGVLVVGILSLIISAGAFAGLLSPVAIAQADSHSMHPMKHMEHDRHAVMMKVYENYFAIRAALARDSLEGVTKNSKAITEEIGSYLQMNTDNGLSSLLGDMKTAAGSLAEKGDLTGARSAFGDLSQKLVDYQAKYMTEKDEKAHVFMCDMVKKQWLQKDTDLGNPYFGSSMLKCGREIK